MRITISEIKEMKQKGEKIPVVNTYDYVTAKLGEEAGVPLIGVGDSLGMVILGYESTIPVTMEDMIRHTQAVVRGTKKALIAGDMPFMTYTNVSDALRNAARFIQEGGAQAVKLEGGESIAEVVKRIIDYGIPVMGHIGLTPQSVYQLSGYRAQGKTPESAKRLLKDALILEEAGVFAIGLECVPAALSKLITQKVSIPTIGIGAGLDCDGQVQILSDILGLYTEFVPKHAKQYAKLGVAIKNAISAYVADVRSQSFPTSKESYTMDESILADIS